MVGVNKGVATAGGAIKTLGAAMGSRAKEKFSEAVRNTSGGRLAHKIKNEFTRIRGGKE
jgi:hypothetical protein